LKPYQKALMLRRVMLEMYGGNFPASNYGVIIRKIAAAYSDVDIAAFEKEQREIRDKRETRAKDRIKLMKKASKKKTNA
jgi:hypothetical protein